MNATSRSPLPVLATLSDLTLLFAGSALLMHAFKKNRREQIWPSPISEGTLGTAFLLCSALQPTRNWLQHHRDKKLSRRRPQLHMDETTVLYAKPNELFAYWRDLRSLSELIPAIHNITPTAENGHHWTLISRSQQPIQWETEIVRQEDDRLIAWQSISGSPIHSRGSLRFTPQENGRTQLRVILQFQRTDSPQSRLLASSISGATSKALRTNLQRFKDNALELFAPTRSPKQENL